MGILTTILKSGVFNEYGQLLAIGSSYTPFNDDYAKSLIQSGKALDVNNVFAYPIPTLGAVAMPWGSRPNPALFFGSELRFTDVGAGTADGRNRVSGTGGGNYFIATMVRWKPVGGNLILDAVDTANSALANTSEQNLNPNHIVIPAGVIADFDRLRLRFTVSKNGTVDTSTIQIKFGPLGTVADPVIGSFVLATTNQSDGVQMEYKRLTATTLQKLGNASGDQSYNGQSATAFPAAATVSNMDTTPMYLSVTSTMTTGAEICTLRDYTLELFATDSQ